VNFFIIESEPYILCKFLSKFFGGKTKPDAIILQIKFFVGKIFEIKNKRGKIIFAECV